MICTRQGAATGLEMGHESSIEVMSVICNEISSNFRACLRIPSIMSYIVFLV